MYRRLAVLVMAAVFVTGSPAIDAQDAEGPPKTIVLLNFSDGASRTREAEAIGRAFGYRVEVIESDFNEKLEDVYRRAEAGEIQLDTMIAAGHSLGSYFWGTNGRLGDQQREGGSDGKKKFNELRAKYPNAAAQVQVFIGLGCYTGKEAYMKRWASGFPNASLRLGFPDGSPSSNAGGSDVIRDVLTTVYRARERAGTRSFCSPQLRAALRRLRILQLSRASFHLCDLSHNVNNIDDVDQLRTDWEGMKVVTFDRYKEAETEGYENPPPDPHDYNSDLRRFYKLTHDMLAVVEGDEADEIDAIKEQTIRLIYFDDIKSEFWEAHTADLAHARQVIDSELFPATKEAFMAMNRQQVLLMTYALSTRKDDEVVQRLKAAARKQLLTLDTPIEWIT